jgi:GTPase SAR1 family protein
MAFCSKRSAEEEETAAVSKRIEQQLRAERAKVKDPVKLLLLGTGASGKSTFLKQLKIIHKDGFSATEIDQFRDSLPMSSVQSMQKLLKALLESDKKVSSKRKAAADKIIFATELNEEVSSTIKDFWGMEEIKELFEKRSEVGIQVDAAAPYYFDNVDRYAKAGFTPSSEDMIRARIKTTGIREVHFDIKDREFVIVDVGGQRSERRKWIHCFDNVNAIIYLASLDEYDMRLEEDNRTNCLEESLQLFSEISGSQFFTEKEMAWILFLNKTDLLEEKIKTKPLNVFYKEFPATSAQDFDASVLFIREKYQKKYRGPPTALYIYSTCAIDTKNCQKVFDAVRDNVVSEAFDDAFG